MKKVIYEVQAKLGTVTITEYTENGHTEYCVKHSHPAISAYWTQEPFNAKRRAQFLVAKY